MVVKSQIHSSESDWSNVVQVDKSQKPRWLHVFSEARTQILLCYVALMAAFVGLSIPVIYQELYRQINQRLRSDVAGEVNEFREEIALEQLDTVFQLKKFMVDYVLDERAEKDLFFIGIVDRQILTSNPRELPESIRPDAAQMEQFHSLQEPLAGKRDIPDPRVGNLLYAVEPVQFQGETRGVFMVAYLTADERQEVDAAFRTILSVMLLILIFASLLTWIIAGRILRPLQLMSSTARSISESDLSQRIQVKSNGEMADIAKTFNEMLDRLQNAFASQRDFINDASHELQTPIAIIQGHLDMMGDEPEERRETLAIVTDELGRMSRFVDDLLLLAKTEQPDFLMLETVEIGTLAEELYAKAIALAPRNWCLESKVSVGIVAEVSVGIVADPQRLTQAMMNLAQNATQHTKEGDTIALGSKLIGNNVRLWVRDTGRGIALTEQKRIFERFARSSNSHRRSKGAGLGLSIVSAIAQAHGGHVELFSRPGGGSTFTLVLPIEPPTEVVSYEPNCYSRR